MGRQGFRRIADDLRERIRTGELPSGAQLPTTKELIQRFQTTNITVRRAIDELTREGLIEGRQPVGMFVCDQQRHVLEISEDELTEFSPSVPSLGDRYLLVLATPERPVSQTLDVKVAVPPSGIVDRLRSGTRPVVIRHRVMFVGGDRASIADSYFPTRVAHGTDLERPALFERNVLNMPDEIARRTDYLDEEGFVRPATAQESHEMGWPAGKPLLGQMLTAYDAGDSPVACLVSLMPAERWIARRRRRGYPVSAVHAVN